MNPKPEWYIELYSGYNHWTIVRTCSSGKQALKLLEYVRTWRPTEEFRLGDLETRLYLYAMDKLELRFVPELNEYRRAMQTRLSSPRTPRNKHVSKLPTCTPDQLEALLGLG